MSITDVAAEKPGRRRGREARRQARTEKPVGFLPELDRKIPVIDLMTPDQVERIHDATMTLLEGKGIEFRDDESIALWRCAGARPRNTGPRAERRGSRRPQPPKRRSISPSIRSRTSS